MSTYEHAGQRIVERWREAQEAHQRGCVGNESTGDVLHELQAIRLLLEALLITALLGDGAAGTWDEGGYEVLRGFGRRGEGAADG